MSSENPNTEAEVVERLARAAGGVQAEQVHPDELLLLSLVRERVFSANRDGYEERVRVIDLEGYAARPKRRSGLVKFEEPGSFERYVNEFQSAGGTRLYADLAGGQVTAILNDDNPNPSDAGNGAWRDHQAVLLMQPTLEWMAWTGRAKVFTGQVEFAEFLEEHLADVIEPSSADLIEIARTFTASNNISFRSAVNLSSGETQFAYDEELEAKAGAKKQLTVPTEFKLSLSIYEGTDPVQVTARLRWRLKDGDLRIGYLLNDAKRMEREAFRSEVATASAATGLEAFFGTPAGPVRPRG